MSSLRESFRFLHTDRWFSEEAELWLFPINSSLKTSIAAQYFEHAHLNICQLKLWTEWAGEQELQVKKEISHTSYVPLKIRKIKDMLRP